LNHVPSGPPQRVSLQRDLERARSPVVGSWKLHLELAANCGRMAAHAEVIHLTYYALLLEVSLARARNRCARTCARQLPAINAEVFTIHRSASRVITGNSLPGRRLDPTRRRFAAQPKLTKKYDTFMTLALFVTLLSRATY
jgi:hypothetical protein